MLLITGATSTVGSELIAALLPAQAAHIPVITRNPGAVFPDGTQKVVTDLGDSDLSTTGSPDTSLARHELAAWRGMLEAHARVTQQLDAQMHAEHGLSLSAYEVLMFLADAPEHRMRMSEIAKAVLLSRSGGTRLVDRLVDQGYLTRHADTTDGRGLYAQLTNTGLDMVNAARSTHHQGIRRFFLEALRTSPTDLE